MKNPVCEKFDRICAEYLANRTATGASEKTITAYTKQLKVFSLWLEQAGLTADPVFQDIAAWRDGMLSEGLSANTIKQYMTCVKRLFEYGVAFGHYDTVPVNRYLVPTNKAEKRPYDQILTDQQVTLLWQDQKAGRTRHWPRSYAVVVLILTTGLRNAEVLALTPRDVDFSRREITVRHGKGDKYRIVDFPALTETALRAYLASGLRPADLPDDAPLFGSYGEPKQKSPGKERVWKPFTPQWLSAMVERHVYDLTGVSGVRTHDLRHICARLDLNTGMPIEELQAKLGHEQITTTQIYSGRLAPRRGRESARACVAERDRQAEVEMEKLAG